MKFLDDINDETLIICTNQVKDMIIKNHILKQIKFITLNDFIHKYIFTYDENTIMYVMDKYNIKYDVAKCYLDNMYYIENKEYGIYKLDFLVNLKNELDSNNLLTYNIEFESYVKRVPIILFNIDKSKYLDRILSGLNYQFIDREYRNYTHYVYEADTINDEVWYVAHEIASLVDKGIDISRIKLMNVTSDYYSTIERIFSLFNLKVNINYKSKLACYPNVLEFINNYRDTSLEEAISLFDKNSKIYDTLVNVINKYIRYDNKELLIYKILNSDICSCEYDNGIEIVNYLDYISQSDEYIFMLGFNDSIMPNTYTDTEYITDNVSEYVGLNNTLILNERLREKIYLVIGDIKNLTITYKLRDYKKNYYPSTLVNKYQVKKIEIDYLNSYSSLYDKMRLVNMYDNYFKFGYKDDNFDIFNSNYRINYNSYSNKFSGIDREFKGLNLSYSKIQIYNKCAFRYYLSDILKLDIFLENFSTVIGSMVHYVMEKCLSLNSMDVSKYALEFIGDRELNKKEKFFLDKYILCIHELLDQVLLEREYSLFKDALYEEKIDIDYGENIHFIGIIDKVLYYVSDNTTYLALIDYKTGADDISLKYLKYGLNIQLPIYLYLSTKLNFKNVKYTGFYLQRFNITDRDYRLVGYSNSDIDTLSVIDNNYNNSKIIKGLKTVSSGGFSKLSKVLSDNEINDVIEMAKDEIDKVTLNIKNNKFPINPKVIDGKNIGCLYCKFSDICFKRYDDEVILTEGES